MLDINQIKEKDSLMALIGLVFSISPGALAFLYFDRSLFQALDAIKIIILSLSLTTPLVMINSIFALAVATRLHKEEKTRFFIAVAASSMFSGLIVYFAVGIAYIFSIKFITFLIVIGIIEIIYIILFICREKMPNW